MNELINKDKLLEALVEAYHTGYKQASLGNADAPYVWSLNFINDKLGFIRKEAAENE